MRSVRNRKRLLLGSAFVLASGLSVAPPALAQVRIDADDIGGTVTGPKGAEAGVWVIAETTDLPTKYAKIVVTDDKGRYVIPDLPKANYSIWVRGYGLVDSPKVTSAPGKELNLKSVPAPNAAAAAQYYPAIYWFAMLKIPEKSLFPGTGASGNAMPETLKDQGQWLRILKTDGCVTCHQLGNKLTREITPELKALGPFDSSAVAWERRLQSGQASSYMVRNIGNLDTNRALTYFGEWSDSIAKGALPFAQPSRPAGKERNVVVTLWDWQTPTTYLHDEIATDKRNPTINAYGPIYGSPEESTDKIPVLDPKTHTVTYLDAQLRDPATKSTKEDLPMFADSPYWGAEKIWDSKTNIHNPMLDEKGRVWFTTRIRPGNKNPEFCKQGSDHPAAKLFPTTTAGRHLSMYDPKTKKFVTIDTCFGTHHLQFAADKDNTLWFSGGGQVAGWFNRRVWEETGDEAKAQMWTPFILDTNGNGKRDEGYVAPTDPVDPKKDKRIVTGLYGASPEVGNPRVVWGSTLGFPGGIVRVDIGANPPASALTEYYEVPWKDPKAPIGGYGPRGMDIDTNGVVWAPLASGHLAAFDRRKCKGPLNGPSATGKHCPEGWTLYPFPGPQFKGLDDSGSAEASYYTWVDQHDTLGLGKDVPMATGNQSDAMFAFVDGKFVTLHVPYPLGFYAKGMDGRIDDAKAGWKGRGLWTASGSRANWHSEGGKNNVGKLVQIQMRPDPLAK